MNYPELPDSWVWVELFGYSEQLGVVLQVFGVGWVVFLLLECQAYLALGLFDDGISRQIIK